MSDQDQAHRIEQIAKGLPDASDVYIDPQLTNVAEDYVQSQDVFIAREMFPSCPVEKQTGQFPSYSKADYNRDEMTERADGDESATAGFRETWKSYAAKVFSLAHDVGPQRKSNAANWRQSATRFLQGKGLLKGETRFATLAWGTGKWSTEYTGVQSGMTGAQVLTWMDADADPVADLEIIIEAYELKSVNFPINRLAFSRDVWRVFKNHPNVIARFNAGQTTGGAKVTRQALADLLEIEKILVAGAIKTTSGPMVAEASSTFGRIFSTGVLGLHATSSPSIDEPSAGYHFDWTGYTGAGAQGQAIFEMPKPLVRGASRLEIEQASDIKQSAADLGFWIEDILHAAA